jgi:glycosyltransferase involved in cell wall biosynthesis
MTRQHIFNRFYDNNNPLISVIMPSYNNGPYIGSAIESILNQTYGNFELLIIDDGSNDNTNIVLNSLSDSRIKVIRNHQRLGLVNSLNIGIECAIGEYIARMDTDDIAEPIRLREQLSYLKKNPDCIFIGSWFIKFKDKKFKKCKLPTNYKYLSTVLLLHNSFAHPTIMGKTELFKKEKYRNEFKDAEDYDLIVRLSKYGKIANIPKYLLYYRIHNKSISIAQKESQIINSNQIRLNLINEIGIKPTEQERDIHLNMLCDLHKPFKNSPVQLMKWINKIINANKKYNKYPSIYLRIILYLRFFEIIRELFRARLGKLICSK